MAAITALTGAPLALSEAILLDRSQAGDRVAMDEVFRRYRGIAYRVAFRLLGNEADALDAVQDAFIKIFTHLNGFEGRSSFKTWVLRVVSNAALDVGRQRGRRDQYHDQSSETREIEVSSGVDDIDRRLEQADLRRALDKALNQLTEVQRQTFVLYVYGELSYSEVAETLKISVGTVMSRLFYTRKRLRAILGDKWTP